MYRTPPPSPLPEAIGIPISHPAKKKETNIKQGIEQQNLNRFPPSSYHRKKVLRWSIRGWRSALIVI